MTDRCFPLPDDALTDDANRGKDYYRARILTLSQKCWDHYDAQRFVRAGRSILKETLYSGSLGPCCYMRYRMATSPSFPGDTDAKFQMLVDALSSANAVLLRERRVRDEDAAHQVTLLNGELVGALTMKIVIGDKVLRMMVEEDVDSGDISTSSMRTEIQDSMNQLFMFAEKYILSSSLSSSECEVLNGRSGYLKAIKFIQTELSDSNFGKQVACEVLAQILEEGIDVGGGTLLLWKWKQKIYLGGLHGIAGVLHTCLDFEEELARINPDVWRMIELTVMKMNDYCLKSGNIASYLKTTLPNSPPKNSDKLVQFCSGSPGYALLLTQMYRKSRNREQDPCSKPPSSQLSENYLLQAQYVAR